MPLQVVFICISYRSSINFVRVPSLRVLNGGEKSDGLKETCMGKKKKPSISQNIVFYKLKLGHFQAIPIMMITQKIESLAEPCNFTEFFTEKFHFSEFKAKIPHLNQFVMVALSVKITHLCCHCFYTSFVKLH